MNAKQKIGIAIIVLLAIGGAIWFVLRTKGGARSSDEIDLNAAASEELKRLGLGFYADSPTAFSELQRNGVSWYKDTDILQTNGLGTQRDFTSTSLSSYRDILN